MFADLISTILIAFFTISAFLTILRTSIFFAFLAFDDLGTFGTFLTFFILTLIGYTSLACVIGNRNRIRFRLITTITAAIWTSFAFFTRQTFVFIAFFTFLIFGFFFFFLAFLLAIAFRTVHTSAAWFTVVLFTHTFFAVVFSGVTLRAVVAFGTYFEKRSTYLLIGAVITFLTEVTFITVGAVITFLTFLTFFGTISIFATAAVT